MVCVCRTSTLHTPRWCICPGSRLRRQPAPRSKRLPIMFWDHCPYCHQRSGERQEKRTKTPYSLHIHLITTQLNIFANRHVVNRFTCLFSGIGRATSSCAARGRAQVHDLTYQLESLSFCQLLASKKKGFFATCNVWCLVQPVSGVCGCVRNGKTSIERRHGPCHTHTRTHTHVHTHSLSRVHV
jgi:hypothetical protein